MGGDANLTFWAMAIVGMIIAHVGLLLSSRWFNVLFVLFAGFCVLSPMSGAPEFPLVVPAKYGRVYVTLLIIVLGIGVYRTYRLRPTALIFLVFVGFYAAAGAWSDAPLAALKYKGLYLALVLAGLLLGNAARSVTDLQKGMRLVALAGALFALFIFYEFVRNPSAISGIGRLATWGMNGNRIGQTAAPLMVMASFVALYDPVKAWKVFAFSLCGALGVIIIYTASRGAAGEAMIGCFVVGLPLMRRPLLWASVAAIAFASAYVALNMIDLESTERFFEMSLETRENPWGEAIYLWQDSPIYGHGWVYHLQDGGSLSTDNLHSIYMQSLAEAGMIGCALLILVSVAAFGKSFMAWREMRSVRYRTELIYLPIGMTLSVLIHGAFESAPITGGMIGGIALPAGLALLDRVPELVRQELGELKQAYAEYYDQVQDAGADFDTAHLPGAMA